MIDARVCVSPTLSKEQATASLSAAATSFPARLWSRPIQPTRVELVYLPYYFFDITLSQGVGTQRVGVAIDAVLGATVFFIGDTLVRKPGCDGAACDFVQSPSVARETAMEEYRWLLLEHGLRNKCTVSVQEISEPERVHYPFWVAYFKKRGSYDFKALDAVSGEVQGIKMRKVFLAAFRQMTD
ncbi:MAG: hypothetical protein AMS25_13890 [Gemmatimonas sp. SM23_52]|nr:MAG: hypothetical protein AMS25_13890 [Gemmatimonas sp. SM23_52]